jgi:geranylgeranyl diphosphate synthase, type II
MTDVAAATIDEATELLKRHADALAAYLPRVLSRNRHAPPRLMDSIAYSLNAGGKRLRPALILESCKACGGSPGDRSAMASAGAMELIHTFSLVHDDLPAMDDDDLRRGRPTNHKVYGEAMAILAGDAMVTLAFELLATDAEPRAVGRLVKELAWASGPEGMIGGQVLDIDGEHVALSLDQLQEVHRMKTGALLTASCRMGAIAAGASDEQLDAITEYGKHLGIAFQIVDDLLDVTATPEQMGKATNKDADSGKNTYPKLMGIEASRQAARGHIHDAIAALASFGASADGLRAAAQFVVARQF